MSGPEDFESIIQDQFSIREQSGYSATAEFPYLDPEGRVAALAIQLQLDMRHGIVSTTSLGRRMQEAEQKPSLERESLLTGYRLATFTGFYERMQILLDNPGDDPEPAILHVDEQAFIRPFPEEATDTRGLFEWAVHLACKQSYDTLDGLGKMVADMRPNLNRLINEIFILYQIDHKNFQELLEK